MSVCHLSLAPSFLFPTARQHGSRRAARWQDVNAKEKYRGRTHSFPVPAESASFSTDGRRSASAIVPRLEASVFAPGSAIGSVSWEPYSAPRPSPAAFVTEPRAPCRSISGKPSCLNVAGAQLLPRSCCRCRCFCIDCVPLPFFSSDRSSCGAEAQAEVQSESRWMSRLHGGHRPQPGHMQTNMTNLPTAAGGSRARYQPVVEVDLSSKGVAPDIFHLRIHILAGLRLEVLIHLLVDIQGLPVAVLTCCAKERRVFTSCSGTLPTPLMGGRGRGRPSREGKGREGQEALGLRNGAKDVEAEEKTMTGSVGGPGCAGEEAMGRCSEPPIFISRSAVSSAIMPTSISPSAKPPAAKPAGVACAWRRCKT